MTKWRIRPAGTKDLAPLARIFHDAWHEAHAAFVPPAILPERVPSFFAARLALLGDKLRTAGPAAAPLGFCSIEGAELELLFLAAEARGSGLAAHLAADAEARLAAESVTTAHLFCVDGNDRAARFYAGQGWQPRGREEHRLWSDNGPFFVRVLRFEKRLVPGG